MRKRDREIPHPFRVFGVQWIMETPNNPACTESATVFGVLKWKCYSVTVVVLP